MSPSNALPFAAPLHVRVPCSTSNLGPGFDLLGLALSLWLDVEASPLEENSPHKHLLCLEEDSASHWPTEENLLMRAFDAAFSARDQTAPRCRFEVKSQIPMARGLGSSGAAVAAGLLLAHQILNEGSEMGGKSIPEELHALGIELEGHPDNVTASLFGGCTLCLPSTTAGPAQHPMGLVNAPLSSALAFSVAWTDTTLTTEEARTCLPSEVSFSDAVENPRRLAMLLEGLRTADPHLLQLGQQDALHHRYRLPLIPGGEEALKAATEAGAWMVAINGSGSSLLAIGPQSSAEQLADTMAKTLSRFAPGAAGYALEAVHGSPQVATVRS